ncbi:hypothetical protein [Thalassotalea sp. PLHSN55]|uniref:hypothetical protein n=1 Tax=Thalassotalea sp. PLHSN55 TaxID=3435888 RepID=UPI003F876665
MKKLIISAVLLASANFAANAYAEEEKHPDDPTKVITKLGFNYTDEVAISGSLALDEARKINVRTNTDASEWRIGGSWLFDFGILNFSLNRSEYDDGGNKNSYSVGTFLPINKLGVDTGKWQIFATGGFNHNKTETFQETEPELTSEMTMIQNASNGGYLGAFALRPITDKWTFMTFGGGGMGSGGYRNAWGGAGTTYKFNNQHSMNVFGFVSDDDYGTVSKVGVSYTYEFK